jgi:hypothetical protein
MERQAGPAHSEDPQAHHEELSSDERRDHRPR